MVANIADLRRPNLPLLALFSQRCLPFEEPASFLPFS
jgi:hypothetical protein